MKSGEYIVQPAGYKAFIPERLPLDSRVDLTEEVQYLLSEADRQVARLDGIGFSLPNPDLFMTMYVRKEALLSSQIEGTQATMEDVLVFEKFHEIDNFEDVKEVVNYIKALYLGIGELDKYSLTIRVFNNTHKALMKGVRGEEKFPGNFRKTQNWIHSGGIRSIENAEFVPPPPNKVPALISNLEKFIHNKDHIPPLIKCALLHYQFETIHPFLDGNGRLGRLLVTLYLCYRQILEKPLLYLSYYLKMHRREYFDRLMLVRNKGDFTQWIVFFLKGVIWTAKSSIDSIRNVLSLQAELRETLLKETKSSALNLRLLNLLFDHPLITSNDIIKKLKVTPQTASSLATLFLRKKIIQEISGKKRGKRYLFHQYLKFIN